MYRGKDRLTLPLFLDCRLVIGVLFLKHMTGFSDEEIIKLVNENPYMQAFCGLDYFATEPLMDSSSLSKVRKRLGAKYFAELEHETYQVLIERKIIRGKGMLLDATVFPEYVRYPTDTGLLNEAREWTVKQIKRLGDVLGEKVRTYCRKARNQNPSDRWRKQKQRERNRIEGSFGHAKNHFDLDTIKYYIEGGPEIWVRLGLLGMNLQTAMKRV